MILQRPTSDMWKVTKKQYTPILTGLWVLVEERGWEVDVVPLVVGQRSVREESGWNPSGSLGSGTSEGGWEKDHRETGSYPPE